MNLLRSPMAFGIEPVRQSDADPEDADPIA
jgi:hypothetical protein